MNNKFLSQLQRLGKALMTPVAVLPAAALLLRLGADDVFNIKWMFAAGDAIFGNLALLFAIGIAIGFADENNGVAGLAAAVGYFVLTKVAGTFNEKINMGVLAGIIVGVLSGYLYNKYKSIRVPDFLGFFGGKRFVPIITSFYTLIIGVLAGYIWPLIQNGISSFGNAIANSGAAGAGLFGFLNRLLIPFGLHHVINSFVWFQFGEFTNAAGKVVTGDLTRFFAKDPTAGIFMTGFFPIMMFALPAACIAMISAARKEQRKAVAGMLLGVAFTSFLTGITEPIEFTFMFLAPVLYLSHAVLTGISLALTTALGIRLGFGFSAGFIDYILSFGIASKPILMILIGLIFAVIYYFLFLYVIKKFDLPTPGRMEEESAALSGLRNEELKERAAQILEAVGGTENISVIDACVTRIRLTAKDASKVNELRLKELGATGILKMGSNNFQIVVGTVADPLVTHIKALMK
ncbi:N-acetylglucosamine-specific PTS transporter subunit IIBC [Fonticella tunisiensis]|uniref:PTS system N-acetylglucosamine-specific IIB component (Glc family) /PTS system N-acetylglucosamine-specific IIC component (Glc family) n=1 Tax=Fonticella tunisiensis TaxID=1096341 RepID=A0A4R7KQ84_9CLOT|nr:N-acetylglucosamine-specific PTS transporter subunit IIBC [Fonticella tunisiensis]TDT61320.1 PTS system N-acetylglucosamine-specific IIB component (Glc family) /PTS system N-acetylglucosamine-specific IIC component (Glc family) [Fonticella tunisiensis]